MPTVDTVTVELLLLNPAPAALRAVLREGAGRFRLRGVTLGAGSARFRTPTGAFGRSEEVVAAVRPLDSGCVVRLEARAGEEVRRELEDFAARVAARLGQPAAHREPVVDSWVGDTGFEPVTSSV